MCLMNIRNNNVCATNQDQSQFAVFALLVMIVELSIKILLSKAIQYVNYTVFCSRYSGTRQ